MITQGKSNMCCRFWKFFCLLVMMLAAQLSPADIADSVYLNGQIYTVNNNSPWAQAVAIKNRRFQYAGSNTGARKYVGKDTEVIDLKGQMAMPGIHDGHQHLMLAGARASHWCKMPEGPIGDAFERELKECAGTIDREWLEVGLYTPQQFPDGKPDRKYLDKLFPDRPVVLMESTFHFALVNTRGLEIAGITRDSKAPEGGEFRKDENGRLTGELFEKARGVVARFTSRYTAEERRASLVAAMQIGNQYGVVSVQEAGTTEDDLRTLKMIDEQGGMTVHVSTHIAWDNEFFGMPAAVADGVIARRGQYASEHVNPNNVKIIMDGVPSPPYLTQADLDESGEPELDMILVPPQVLNEQVVRFDKMGMKMKFHVAGAGASHVALDAIAKARRVNKTSSILHELGHAAVVVEPDMDRMRELNVVGEMSPAFWHLRGNVELGEPPRPAWQFRSLANKGVLLTIGSDWPVVPSPNLFPGLGGILAYGDETIDLISGIRALTINGAISVNRQDETGSIETGKLANMIVLDRNLFEVPVSEIGGTQVDLTVFEGKQVYIGKKN